MDQPLRVLCVTPSGPEGRGGIDRLFRYLREARVLTLERGLALRFFAARGAAERRVWFWLFPWRVLRFAAVLARWRPDVVHLNFATGGSLPRKLVLAWLAKRWFGRAVVIQFHGQFPSDGIAARTVAGRMFLALSSLADRVVALGPVSEARFRTLAGVPAARLRVVPNGIADFASGVAVPKGAAGRVRIAFVGKVGDHKGVPLLVEALARLAADGRWECVVAGDGEVKRCKSLARASGLAQRIRFAGWCSPEAVHRLMIASDVVVLPSLSENMPLSLIEGACAGAALVATRVGETPDIVRDGVNGTLVPRDPAAVAAAIVALLDDRLLLGRMQAASRTLYEDHFTLDAMARRLEAVYREAGSRATDVVPGTAASGASTLS